MYGDLSTAAHKMYQTSRTAVPIQVGCCSADSGSVALTQLRARPLRKPPSVHRAVAFAGRHDLRCPGAHARVHLQGLAMAL